MDAAYTSPLILQFGKEEMKQPSEFLLLAWVIHCCDVRYNKVSTIEKNLKLISGTLLECTGFPLHHTTRIDTYLAEAK